MDSQIDRWTDKIYRNTDRQIDRWTVRQIDGQLDRQIDRNIDRQIEIQTDIKICMLSIFKKYEQHLQPLFILGNKGDRKIIFRIIKKIRKTLKKQLHENREVEFTFKLKFFLFTPRNYCRKIEFLNKRPDIISKKEHLFEIKNAQLFIYLF